MNELKDLWFFSASLRSFNMNSNFNFLSGNLSLLSLVIEKTKQSKIKFTMKTTKLTQLLILVLILSGLNANAQIPAIDSLKIIPENANPMDEIKVICYATFPSGSCNLVNHSLAFQGNQITLNLEYEIGAATYICHSVDTVSLGILNAGDYDLQANLIISPFEEIVDSESISFTIDGSLGLDDHLHSYNFSVYPNPFTGLLQIRIDGIIENIEVRSLSGQELKLDETGVLKADTIDLSDLNNGIYLLIVTDAKGYKWIKRIIKESL